MKRNAIFLTLLVCLSSMGFSQSEPGVNGWIDREIDSILDQQVVEGSVGQNGKGADRQKESPATDTRSTSLVDQTSATDFFSVAASLVPVSPGSGTTTGSSGAEGSTTATVSLYAILAGLNKVSPTDPRFYAAHIFSRRFSFTVGTAASTIAMDNSDKPASVYGAKVLLINDRELYKKQNLQKLIDVQKANANAAAVSVKLQSQIKKLIFASLNPDSMDSQGEPKDPAQFGAFLHEHLVTDAAFENTFDSLSDDTKKKIQNLIEGSLPVFSEERATLEQKYDEISKAQQLSLSYTANIRDSQGNNDHRIQLIFDYGLSPRINWTVNASGDYTDRKNTLDSKGGRLATSFQGNLTKSKSGWGKTPIRLTFSGEGKWLTSQKPQYTFQSELSIPLSPGLDLPIVYRYANRTAQLNQTDSEARLGLSVDISRLAQAFKQNAGP
jgi:hypothetical protein